MTSLRRFLCHWRTMTSLRRFLCHWQTLLALALVGIYVLVGLTAPLLAPPDDPEDPSSFRTISLTETSSSRNVPQPPNEDLRLGTVPGGLDVYYSLIWGTRPVLRFSLAVTLTTACFGILVGAVSGYAGGVTGRLAMRVADAFLAVPSIAGVFLFREIMAPPNPATPPTPFQEALGTLNLDPLMLALMLFSWMPYARLINANVTRLKSAEFAMAATTMGATHTRIILRHLLPNAISPAIVLAARDVGGMAVLEAAFTFIGAGAGYPWGVLLVSGRDWIVGPGANPLAYWWTYAPATVALILYGVGWNLLGDRLNDAVNPRSQQSRL